MLVLTSKPPCCIKTGISECFVSRWKIEEQQRNYFSGYRRSVIPTWPGLFLVGFWVSVPTSLNVLTIICLVRHKQKGNCDGDDYPCRCSKDDIAAYDVTRLGCTFSMLSGLNPTNWTIGCQKQPTAQFMQVTNTRRLLRAIILCGLVCACIHESDAELTCMCFSQAL